MREHIGYGSLLARLDMPLSHYQVVVQLVRPIEQHIKGFEALGAEIHLENGNIYASTKDGLKGTDIHLDFLV